LMIDRVRSIAICKNSNKIKGLKVGYRDSVSRIF